MNKISLLFFVMINIWANSCPSTNTNQPETLNAFAQSFIQHYDVQPEGRYAHEYHPFLLSQTAQSLDDLEACMSNHNFDLCGRMIIFGYEENAVPSYYTDYTRAHINDEATVLSNAGWSTRLHNRFGFMTGFLFRSVNDLAARYFPEEPPVFDHILSHNIHLFNSRAAVFQQHAFGQAYNLVLSTEQIIINCFKRQAFKSIFSELITFWSTLYDDALKVGNKQLAGTQDILFSIEYAKHLLRSSLPVFHYFTGPDITYPIELSCKYQQDVTDHSQAFVKQLAKQLEPRENQSTAYIFCSFVDGVGKSTMLGNIKNWITHGSHLEKFQHVDNSSSQLAEIFPFKENVYIVDLPAQISHFTYKPDGLVYVDAQTELTREKIDNITEHFYSNQDRYTKKYQKLVEKTQAIQKNQDFLADCFHDKTDPELAFVKNILLLKKLKTNHWIPFSYDNNRYIFNNTIPSELRILIPLDQVKSEGLKNIESEQMLFFHGLKFPPAYETFTQDLTQKLSQAGVKKIVFVDFMSMYPRSCRENVRINYLLQQMAHLDETFDPHNSLYRNFVSGGGELLASFKNKGLKKRMTATLEHETILRYILYTTIVNRADRLIHGYSLQEITALAHQAYKTITAHEKNLVSELVTKKIAREAERLSEIYGLTKDFITIQQFSFERAKAFSDMLIDLFLNQVENKSLVTLWDDLLAPAKEVIEHLDNGAYNGLAVDTSPEKQVRLYAKQHVECRNEFSLSPMLRMMRAAWYATVINLLYSEKQSDESYFLKSEYFSVPPLYLATDNQDHFMLLQKMLAPWDQEISLSQQLPMQIFSIPFSKTAPFGKHDNRPYPLNWHSPLTNSGIFAYDCTFSPKNNKKNSGADSNLSFVTMVVQRYQTKKGLNTVMPTSLLHKKLRKSFIWKQNLAHTKKDAQKNGHAYGLTKKALQDKIKQNKKNNDYGAEKKNIFLGHENQRAGAQLLARLLATLEMVVKDPDAHVVVRFGNRADFSAALRLFELVTLPRYFSLFFDEPLFENYDQVEPYPSWEYWDKYEAIN